MNYDFIFLGSKLFGLEVLKEAYISTVSNSWLVICPDDSRDSRSQYLGFESFCKLNSIDLIVANSRTSAEEVLTNNSASAALVCGWYWLIPSFILNSFPLGVWGIHDSKLPEYRGGSPLVWALINGEESVGSSLFQITEGMDSGDIIAQVEEVVLKQDDILSISNRLHSRMILEVKEKWPLILTGNLARTKQDETKATYCGQRIPEDGEINWNLPAKEVNNFIRAQCHPYPGAFTYDNGNKIVIQSCDVVPNRYIGTPGQILAISENTVTVSCGQSSAISISKANLVLNDYKLTFNSRLG